MKNKVILFTHVDLDGVGVSVIAHKYIQTTPFKLITHYCGYGEINSCVRKFLNDETLLEETIQVLIGDISVDAETAKLLDEKKAVYDFSVILRDHHATAEYLNVYSWAKVREVDEDGISRCGTYWMAKALDEYDDNKIFVDTVNSWDTWAWKETDNTHAKWLNTLHVGLGDDEFVEYIMGIDMNMVRSESALFDLRARTVVEVLNRQFESDAEHRLKNLRTCKFQLKSDKGYNLFNVGIVFCNNNLSLTADYVLDRKPELDFLMLISLPGSISLRGRKELPVPLGDIANALTGKGGGHPFAAGAGIDYNNFNEIILPLFIQQLNEEVHKVAVYDVKGCN